MADSQQKIDWNALGKAAQQCVGSACSLAHWGERSQEDDYNAENAALHLAAIDRACDTLGRAIALFERRHFNKLALASVGEGPRPDFRFGEACYSTAHETALELLRAGVLHIENGLNDIAEDRGAPDNYVAGIDDLHALSPDELRDTLIDVYARPVSAWAVKEIGFARVKEFQAWIDREWAAVSRTATANQGGRINDPDRPSKEALALALLADHPDWSDTEIAKKAGCSRTTLYTFTKFMAAREILRQGKSGLPSGSKFPDEGIEAWDNEDGG